ncbi:hypothetical protein PENTCL1PPCAC_14971, partial [Pristionchus entomophagus]
ELLEKVTPATTHSIPMLTRTGFQRQVEFNCSLLNELELAKRDPSRIDSILETIKERNQLLTMADKNPQVLELADKAKTLEALSIGSSSGGSALMQLMMLQSLNQTTDRKRRAASPPSHQPFRQRASAYVPAGAHPYYRPPSLLSSNYGFSDNRSSARREAAFVSGEVERLLRTKAIEKATSPRVISPLSVVPGKKPRLIHDLSALNLGYEIDLREGTVRVSLERVSNALERLRHLREVDIPTVGDRSRAVGTLSSASLILGDPASLLSRAILHTIAEAQKSFLPPSTRIPLSPSEKGEIDQWRRELRDRSVKNFVVPPWQFDVIVETDASAIGLGVVIRRADDQVVSTSRNLIPSEREESSTLRELRAIDFAVHTFEREWRDSNVLFFGDNQSAMSILRKGSMKPELHEVAKRVETMGVRMNASFKFHWIPRDMNVEADRASRDFDGDDWALERWVFDQAVKRWGRPDVDMFADEQNAKCERFVSRVPSRGALSIDAFSDPRLWRSHSLLWCVPPPSLLCQTLAWMRRARARGVLGLPYWTSHPVFPTLFPPNHTPSFVKDFIIYPEGNSILIPSTLQQGPFSRLFLDSPFTLLLLDFNFI